MTTGGLERMDHERPAIMNARKGDTSALHYLYVRYADDVYRYVNGMVGDPHDTEDITEAVFARLMTAIRRYDARHLSFTGWILRMARNTALDHMRSTAACPSTSSAGATGPW